MSFGDIVNQLHNKHSFPDTSTAKEPNLSSSLVRSKQINNLERKQQMLSQNTMTCGNNADL